MKTHLVVFAALIFICAPRVLAQPDAERVLVPVWNRAPQPGAFGALWATEIAIVNAGTVPAQINGWDTQCSIALCPPTPATPPGVTFSPNLNVFTREVQGFFLDVDRAATPNVHFSLRVRDLSRQAENWGAEIPVVRESEFFPANSRLQLLDVPMRTEFRHTLRIYDLDPGTQPASARIRIYVTDPTRRTPGDATNAREDRLAQSFEETFRYATSGDTARHPGYIELGDLHTRPELVGSATIRIEVTVPTERHRFWAFLSTTNNNTQQVTIISPQ